MIKKNVTIVDYGTGNLFSVSRAVQYLGYNPIISSEYSEICLSRRLILPGVGAFGHASKNIFKNKIDVAISSLIKQNVPILGICLGMQLFMESSEEAPEVKGLGILKGTLKNLKRALIHLGLIKYQTWVGEKFFLSKTYLIKLYF